MKKNLFFLALLLTVTQAAWAQSGSWSDSDNRDTSWGSNYTTASEFTITTPEQLAQFAYMVNSGSDFSGKTVTLDDGVEEIEWDGQVYRQIINFDGDLEDHDWTPIGTADHPFRGTFDGNGKSISYVKISGSDSYQGFFGYIGTGGKVQSLIFDYGCNISGSTQVGCLAGYNGGTVENCLVLNATVSGTSYVGSIVGQNTGTATTCYSIDCGTTFALGAEGSATGVDSDGHAQCLYNLKADESTISSDNNFTASVGSTTGVQVGHGVFYTDGIQYNFYHFYKTGATTTLTYNVAGYDATFAVSGTGASIDGNTVTVGTEKVIVSLASKTVAEWSGTGNSADDPYLIYTSEQFKMLATRVNDGTSTYAGKFFRLENDINDVYTYTAIGTSEHPFSGTFDGNGHSIDTPQIKLASIPYQGVFGYSNGTIKNLKVTNPYILGGDYTGGIVGYNAGSIENCRVDNRNAVLYGENVHHSYGGIAGYNSGTISHCVSAANVDCYIYGASNTSTQVGGVVGTNPSGGTVGNSYNQNASYAITQAGGIVGHNAEGGTVEHCLYLGRLVTGTAYVGAIVGKNEGTLTANLYHHNGYQSDSRDNIGTDVLGIGISDAVTGTDADGAAKAKVVILPEGGTFSQPYGVTISGTPIYVTTNNPNGMPLSVYSNGILFRDTYFAYDNQSYNTEIGTAFYTIATTVELKAINVPNGYAATFSTESNGASINGNILTVGTDVTEVSVSAQRAASGWLAEGVRAASFSTTGTNNITIMSAAELGLLAYNVNFGGETYEDYTITLGDNIDLNNNTWEPIGYGLSSGMGGGMVSPSIGGGMVIGGGDSASGFLGTFDGAGHTIINMSVEGSMNVGLFSTVDEGVTVKDLFISRAVVKGNMYVGTVAGSVSGTIQNCHVLSSSIEVEASDEMPSGMGGGYGSPIMLGGIAGMSQYGTINGCTIMESSIYPQPASSMGVGGIVGYATNAILTDNLSAADIAKKSSDNYFGAIVGMDMGSTISNNYYVDGLGIYNTPNTELKAVNGTDTEGEAQRAYVYSSKPEGFGDAVTEYGYGMEAYSTGLHYNLEWYSPTEPTSMDITLSSTEDNSTLLSTYSGITGKVTLDRTFTKNGSWYTICLPFDIDINDEDKPSPLDGAELWQMADYDEENPTGFDEESGTLTLNFENCVDDDGISTISAGRPYLIKWNNTGETISNPVFENVTISVTSPEDNNIFGNNGEITFIGTFSPLNITGADNTKLYLGAGNLLYYPYADMTIGALRAYFQLNGITAGNPTDPNATGVRAFVLNFGDGEQTGISDMEANSSLFTPHSSLKDEWFDLSGRRLNGKPTQRGMYISNGRKVVIK